VNHGKLKLLDDVIGQMMRTMVHHEAENILKATFMALIRIGSGGLMTENGLFSLDWGR
jgi:hypothetical protein